MVLYKYQSSQRKVVQEEKVDFQVIYKEYAKISMVLKKKYTNIESLNLVFCGLLLFI